MPAPPRADHVEGVVGEPARLARRHTQHTECVAAAERGEGDSDSDSENAVRSRPRTSLGDGVVKPVGSRIE